MYLGGNLHPVRGLHLRGVLHPRGWAEPPFWTEWQTGVKTLPCPRLRLWAVTTKAFGVFHKRTQVYLLAWFTHVCGCTYSHGSHMYVDVLTRMLHTSCRAAGTLRWRCRWRARHPQWWWPARVEWRNGTSRQTHPVLEHRRLAVYYTNIRGFPKLNLSGIELIELIWMTLGIVNIISCVTSKLPDKFLLYIVHQCI